MSDEAVKLQGMVPDHLRVRQSRILLDSLEVMPAAVVEGRAALALEAAGEPLDGDERGAEVMRGDVEQLLHLLVHGGELSIR